MKRFLEEYLEIPDDYYVRKRNAQNVLERKRCNIEQRRYRRVSK